MKVSDFGVKVSDFRVKGEILVCGEEVLRYKGQILG